MMISKSSNAQLSDTMDLSRVEKQKFTWLIGVPFNGSCCASCIIISHWVLNILSILESLQLSTILQQMYICATMLNSCSSAS